MSLLRRLRDAEPHGERRNALLFLVRLVETLYHFAHGGTDASDLHRARVVLRFGSGTQGCHFASLHTALKGFTEEQCAIVVKYLERRDGRDELYVLQSILEIVGRRILSEGESIQVVHVNGLPVAEDHDGDALTEALFELFGVTRP